MSDVQENSGTEDATDDWAAAMEEQATAEGAGTESAIAETEAADDADRAEFQPLQDEGGLAVTGDENLEVILDIPVTIAMEIGRTRISIRNLLQLSQGSVVELDRLAGEPMDVLVNGTLVAHGEVVVVNEKFGIRLTDVVSPAERVQKLR